jgi:hypothetical protein
MPWWENKTAADAFATAVESSFGSPINFPPFNYGPLFSYKIDTVITPTILAVAWRSDGVLSAQIDLTQSSVNTWAQATPYTSAAPVPGPLPALGAAAAFGFSRQLKKRIKRSANAVSSTYSL